MFEYSLICETRSGHNFVRYNIDSWIKGAKKYHNIESYYIDGYYKNGKYSLPQVKKPYNIVLVRNPLNWIASFIKQLEKANKTPKDMEKRINARIPKWIDITKECLGVTNRLENKHCVIYDDFVVDPEVRKNLCKYLGGVYNESRLKFVPENGQHSSFDSNKFQHNGNKMKVLDQYSFCENMNTPAAKLYFDVLKNNPEIISIYMDKFTEKNLIFLKKHNIIS